MARTIHLSLDVVGFLRWPKRKRAAFAKGTDYSLADLEVKLLGALAGGWLVVPLADCDNFDRKSGCKGHEQEAANSV